MGWNRDVVEKIIRDAGWYGSHKEIQYGVQFVLTDGTKVNCFDSGKLNVQGKDTETKRKAADAFGSDGGSVSIAQPAQNVAGVAKEPPTRVFIVYGHDAVAREQLELLLRRLRLEPIVLQNIPSGGDTIIEKLEQLTAADFACVLLTPDDEGRKREPEKKDDAKSVLTPRARQNVVLEMGMVLAKLGRKRVAVLLKTKTIERPSDIDGLIYHPFESHVDEIKNALAANIQEAGFSIQVKDLLS